MNENPFQAPRAAVADVPEPHAETRYIPDGRRVGIGSCTAWWSRGFALFRMAPFTWIALIAALMLFLIALAFVPLLNFAGSLVHPLLYAGLYLGCRDLERGQPLRMGHLFAAFSSHSGRLLGLGLLTLLGVILAVALSFVAVLGSSGLSLLQPSTHPPHFSFGQMALPLALYFILIVPLMSALVFAPMLIVLEDQPVLAAMRASFFGSMKNFLTLFLFGLLFIPLAIAATIPVLLGWLVLVPTIYCGLYSAYREIFTEPA
jgi:uncharacterized membrane protein